MMIRNLLRFTAGLAVLSALLFTGVSCRADPRPDDVDRIRKDFLELRFRAPLDPRLENKSDLELFRLVCASQNVQCEPVLEMLKEQDPEFYQTLRQSE